MASTVARAPFTLARAFLTDLVLPAAVSISTYAFMFFLLSSSRALLFVTGQRRVRRECHQNASASAPAAATPVAARQKLVRSGGTTQKGERRCAGRTRPSSSASTSPSPSV